MGFADCCIGASLAGPVPAIGNSNSRWPALRFAVFVPFGGGAALVAVVLDAGAFCRAAAKEAALASGRR
jgi:hypothetical protein